MQSIRTLGTARSARRWVVRLSAPVALAVVLPTTVAAEPSNREQNVEELRRRAEQVAGELDRLDLRTNQLDEDYNATAIELAELRQQLDGTRQEVQAAETAITGHREAARAAAVQAFVGEVADDGVSVDAFDDIATDSRRRTYLTSVFGDREQAVSDLGVAVRDLADRQRRLDQAEAKVQRQARTLEAARQELERTIAARRELQSGIDGQLKAAVQAEQRRREAAEAARVEAEARAAAARQRAAVEVRTTFAAMSRAGAPDPRANDSTDAAVSAGDLPPAPGATPGAEVAVRAALDQLGDPYRWAASGPDAFDCSGLIMFAYRAAGRSLPHSSRALRGMARRISVEDLVVGDLVFGGSPVHHVGLYIGNGQMVHSPHSGEVVKVTGIFETSKPVSFGRL